MEYGIDMLFKDVVNDERCCEIFDKLLPNVRQILDNQPMAMSLSLRKISEYSHELIPDEKLKELDAYLSVFNDGGLSPREEKQINFYKSLAKQDNVKDSISEVEKNNSFIPGKVWRDTNGKAIQAHAGCILYEDGYYYWFGENKSHTDGKNGIWSWGINCYKSSDLYNWTNLGLVIPPNLDNPKSNLFPEMHLDRPHVIKCQSTGKYICWIKVSGVNSCFIVLESSTITGPYRLVREDYQPFGYQIGDFDLVVDEKNNQAYLFSSVNHSSVVGFLLSDDYTSVVKEISVSYPDLTPPFTREAISVFKKGEKYYMISSGMTGYLPNQSDVAVADDLESEFISLGDPHPSDTSLTSFNSQISNVFQIRGTELLVAIADRWLPETLFDREQALTIRQVIGDLKNKKSSQISKDKIDYVFSIPEMDDTKANTSIANYIWLPIKMNQGIPEIEWLPEWCYESYLD